MLDRQEVERLAYALWEQEDRPSGKADHYYYEAERLLHQREVDEHGGGASLVVTKAKKSATRKTAGSRRVKSS